MVNSPEPSTSRAVGSRNGEKLPIEDSDSKKKKRTRRKPRSKAKKPSNDCETSLRATSDDGPINRALLPFTGNFVIQTVQKQHGVVYKQRDKAHKPINIKYFSKKGIACVFQTRTPGCDSGNSLKLLRSIEKLSINGLSHVTATPGSSKPTFSKKVKNHDKTPGNHIEKKRKKKKTVVVFPKYLHEDDVSLGLRNGELMRGIIRINPKNFKEAYVGNEDTTKSDYIISSVLDRNRALEGDEVVLRFKTVSEDRKNLMEVVDIKRRVHTRTAVGFLENLDKNKEFAVFLPRDKRIPRLKIPKVSWPSGFQSNPQLYSDILFQARIVDWWEVKYALGVITENLGLKGNLKVESLAILREFCLDPTPFGPEIQEFLPKSCDIPQTEFEYREDFRKECVFTIDPLTARDLDDAVSCKELPNGNFEVGVHISDASSFLEEDTILDEIVQRKATTIYMVDSVYHMLPVELCLHCSLLPGQDKLTFSVIWELTPEGEIVNQRLRRSVINSCVQLAYEHAQMMIDDPTRKFQKDELPEICNGFVADDLSKVVNNLEKIAVCLREKRRRNGSLKIDQVKISFSTDPMTGEPTQFWVYENKPAHRLIEEFMLLANMSVARFIYEAFPDLAFLRLHEPPKPTMMTDLQKNLETVGIHIDISSAGGIQASLNKYIADDFLGQTRMTVLNHLLAKPMKRARYFCAGALEEDLDHTHFALSIPIYTHFTSPIRRYADIMVHRLLAASLNYRKKPRWDPLEVSLIAETCNRQKYHAKRAGDASSDLYLAHYIDKNQPYIQDAVVVDTKERSIDVIVLNTGSVVRIYTNNFGENVTSETQEIKLQKNYPDLDKNGKKMWRILVKFPLTSTEPEVSMVLEIFTLVKVGLTRKPKTNKLDAILIRPVQQNNLITL